MMAGAVIYVARLRVMSAAGGATGLSISGVLIGIALSRTAFSLGPTAAARAVPMARRSKMLGVAAAGVARHIPDTARNTRVARASGLADRCIVLSNLAVAMLLAGFWAGRLPETPGPGPRCAGCSASRPAVGHDLERGRHQRRFPAPVLA